MSNGEDGTLMASIIPPLSKSEVHATFGSGEQGVVAEFYRDDQHFDTGEPVGQTYEAAGKLLHRRNAAVLQS